MTPQAATKSSAESVVSWLLFLIALALAVLVTRRPKAPRVVERELQAPLELVPAGPRLLLSADAAELAKLAGSEMLRAGGDKLLGLRELCGFEPLLLLQRAVFAMPFRAGQGQGSDFALIARTTLDAELGLRCAELVIKKRGGSPARTKLGRFVSVRDLGKPLGEVAMRPDGMFVLSGGRYFRDVMDAAEGAVSTDQASRLRSELHRRMREKLGRAQLTLTLLPDDTLPLPGVDALGLGLQVGRDLALRGLVYCPSAAACGDARQVIEGTKAELGADPGLAGLLALTVTEREGRLEITGRLPREQLLPLLAQLIAP